MHCLSETDIDQVSGGMLPAQCELSAFGDALLGGAIAGGFAGAFFGPGVFIGAFAGGMGGYIAQIGVCAFHYDW